MSGCQTSPSDAPHEVNFCGNMDPIIEPRLSMITPNIWNFSASGLMSWAAAYAVWEPISYIIFPMIFRAATTQEYYNHRKFSFGVVAAGDFLYSTMLLLVAQQVIGFVFGSAGAPNTWLDWSKRLLTFIGVQWVGDLSFYGLVKSLPAAWTPRYLDFFKRYGAQVGIGAPIGDSLYGIVWLLLTQWMATNVAPWIQTFLIVTFLFFTLIVSF